MPADNTSTARTIARRLEQLILNGELAPESRIPSERQLAERLGVSRSMIREALKTLQGRGIIETRHGQGSFVSGILPEVGDSSPLMHLFKDHQRTLYDLLEVRELLEGQAAGLAAERGTDSDFYYVTKAFRAMEEASPQANAELDHAFHRAIVEASHNPVLVHVLNSLKQLTLQSVYASVSNLSHREQFRAQIDRHHRQIHSAVIGRKPQAARKAAAAHVRHVSDSLRAIEQEEQHLIRGAVKTEPPGS